MSDETRCTSYVQLAHTCSHKDTYAWMCECVCKRRARNVSVLAPAAHIIQCWTKTSSGLLRSSLDRLPRRVARAYLYTIVKQRSAHTWTRGKYHLQFVCSYFINRAVIVWMYTLLKSCSCSSNFILRIPTNACVKVDHWLCVCACVHVCAFIYQISENWFERIRLMESIASRIFKKHILMCGWVRWLSCIIVKYSS